MTGQPDYVELCGIEAWVYKAGDEIILDGFLDKFAELVWWFEDPTAKQLADVIELTEGGDNASFKSLAVRFEFYPMFNPDYVQRHPLNVKSAMENGTSSGQRFASTLFEDDEANSIERMAQLAIAYAGDDVLGGACFIGVFNVWWDEYYAFDGGVDFVKIWAEFVREYSIAEIQTPPETI